ncbi:MAG: 1-deoxy-D-xylulose-5-phosphate reductoisomerase [Deltaproteobacteria bacterium]|nr:1-deoxy-D-xylulose-5-phosphate reductoisomerase [Deltaproteobacteria bacterium]MBT4087104.1 1-deoxy-D-xylulose-5-phosphate reductoisomerase [Deltaproteobacteria bacterium]MBT4268097.1 1-deoxy-D-xylulose-5-phosphate reductoisomerase [Deltaproteobacteria bacterium]MBT4640274.1 1-deoxy-D-xylulose-5-phosphate reductoisomerase [Deltaproteobacteria bacterium]MBT6502970.1 1-deoxy-D-xylulose-5-phosphate reductoisomerase [Deltaproteobacteria bacterium]
MNKEKKGIVILGSTGSVGVNTLSVISQNPERFRVDGLSCHNNISLLIEQIETFSPKVVSVSEHQAPALRKMINERNLSVEVSEGLPGHIEVACYQNASLVVAAMVGAAGIEPVMAAIRHQKTIALANKESLVLAGSLLIAEAEQNGVQILPIDSEHNAIFQSLRDENPDHLDHITLTASGGPFRTLPKTRFKDITLEEALKHPNWDMGKKITIDSATMMNKCLEIIEAKWLFRIDPNQVKVLIHPQSIVHSMVTFKDASTISQMGTPDMRIPIANCLGYPDRIISGSSFLNLAETGTLSFETPDLDKFSTLRMAYDVLALGGGSPAALNGANEVLVDLFLKKKIPFIRIFEVLSDLVQQLKNLKNSLQTNETPYLFEINQISDAMSADGWGRDFALQAI